MRAVPGPTPLSPRLCDPLRPRFAIEIIAVGAVLPSASTTRRLERRAIEDPSGVEVTVNTLPTQAAMVHAGAGKRLPYPAECQAPGRVARWTLPAMTVGNVWMKEFAIGAVERDRGAAPQAWRGSDTA